MQEVEVWPYEQMAYAQPRICPREWNAQTPLEFLDTNGSPNLSRRPDLIIMKKNCGFCWPSEPQNKIERMWKEG